MPLIGLVPGYKNAYIASGNCRLGVTLAPATARLLVSMLNKTEQSPDHVYSSQLSWYDPNRFVFRSRRRWVSQDGTIASIPIVAYSLLPQRSVS